MNRPLRTHRHCLVISPTHLAIIHTPPTLNTNFATHHQCPALTDIMARQYQTNLWSYFAGIISPGRPPMLIPTSNLTTILEPTAKINRRLRIHGHCHVISPTHLSIIHTSPTLNTNFPTHHQCPALTDIMGETKPGNTKTGWTGIISPGRPPRLIPTSNLTILEPPA